MVFMVNFKMEKIDWIKLDHQNKTDKYNNAFCFKSSNNQHLFDFK